MTPTITIDRATVEQALEALETYSGSLTHFNEVIDHAPAIAALRAALAQQTAPEPVAWIQPDHLQKARVAPFLCRVEPTQRCPDFVPLYTAPPQRKPLTEEEIDECFESVMFNPDIEPTRELIARAIEQAHGIGGSDE